MPFYRFVGYQRYHIPSSAWKALLSVIGLSEPIPVKLRIQLILKEGQGRDRLHSVRCGEPLPNALARVISPATAIRSVLKNSVRSLKLVHAGRVRQ
jgi:hypothetical protein